MNNKGQRWTAPLSRARAGITLVELIITLVIAAMVIALSATFLLTGSNFLSRTEANAEAKTLAEKSADFIRDRLIGASEVIVRKGAVPSPSDEGYKGKELLYVGNDDGDTTVNKGRLYYKYAGEDAPLDILGNGAYGRIDLALTFKMYLSGEDGDDDRAVVFEADTIAVRNDEAAQNAKQIFRMYNALPTAEIAGGIEVSSWLAEGAGATPFYLEISSPDY